MSDTSNTFGSWRDRITYLLAEAQLVVLGVLFTGGAALFLFRPELPSVPPVATSILASLMLFGPPLMGFWVTFVQRLRDRHTVDVHHVNAHGDTIEKYHVAPDIWSEKTVDGPSPYPVNGGAAWAVQEFDYLDDVNQLTVKGVWLSECEDTKLLTKKSHMESIYGKLTESHIALNIMRESVSELGADIQERITNRGAEARERGKLMDETAVSDVFDNYSEEFAGTGPNDLPTIDIEELADTIDDDPATEEASTDD